jgi:hypothetical protein
MELVAIRTKRSVKAMVELMVDGDGEGQLD